MSDIFISYASLDKERIFPLVRALEAAGWSVFWDRTIPAGKTWREVLDVEVDNCGCMVVVWTAKSIKSRHVHEEADDGIERGVLVPVKMAEVKPPRGFRNMQAANLVDWYGDCSADVFEIFLAAITRIIGPPPIPFLESDTSQSDSETAVKSAEEPTTPQRRPPQELPPGVQGGRLK